MAVTAEPKVSTPVPGPAGLWGWLTTVDHKRIGLLYGVSGLIFFFVGGLESLFIRLQLIGPDQSVLSADAYNQLFTMHGLTMLLVVVMPVGAAFMAGLGLGSHLFGRMAYRMAPLVLYRRLELGIGLDFLDPGDLGVEFGRPGIELHDLAGQILAILGVLFAVGQRQQSIEKPVTELWDEGVGPTQRIGATGLGRDGEQEGARGQGRDGGESELAQIHFRSPSHWPAATSAAVHARWWASTAPRLVATW